MQRRIIQRTMSGQNEQNDKQEEKKSEISRIHVSFRRKDSKKVSFTRVKRECTEKVKVSAAAGIGNTVPQSDGKAEAAKSEGLNTRSTGEKGEGSSSEASPQNRNEESQKKTTFIVLQQNTRSLSSSDRVEEMYSELHKVAWDAILISETWRQNKEIWETQQGHIMVVSEKFTNKHGVAILLNRSWKNHINWVQCACECACERVVAMSISVNKQPIILMSVYMPHSGYPDHQVEKTYNTILKTVGKDKSMKIIGGDFSAELGPGEGIELSAVGHYTLNKANCRGEWLTQWLLENKLVALSSMYRKLPQKQVTCHTPKRVEKQLDHILTDKKHHSWSRDAEANDTIHMGSDHRCVMAKFEIPKEKAKGKPPTKQGADS